MKILCTIMCCVLCALACVGVAIGASDPVVYAGCAVAYGLLTMAFKED